MRAMSPRDMSTIWSVVDCERDTVAEKLETKSINLSMRFRSDQKKLEKLLKEGWTIAAQSTRGALAFKPGSTDYTLTRVR
jgi:hypothetical protein